jgi:hypothetical protein
MRKRLVTHLTGIQLVLAHDFDSHFLPRFAISGFVYVGESAAEG